MDINHTNYKKEFNEWLHVSMFVQTWRIYVWKHFGCDVVFDSSVIVTDRESNVKAFCELQETHCLNHLLRNSAIMFLFTLFCYYDSFVSVALVLSRTLRVRSFGCFVSCTRLHSFIQSQLALHANWIELTSHWTCSIRMCLRQTSTSYH